MHFIKYTSGYGYLTANKTNTKATKILLSKLFTKYTFFVHMLKNIYTLSSLVD